MKLEIISFNIRYKDDENGHTMAERAPRLSAATSRYSPDIIGFQEFRVKWEPLIEKYYGDQYDSFVKYRNQTTDIEAVAILWKKEKFECVKTGYFWLSDTPEVESRGWDELCNCYRICAYVVLKEKQSGKEFVAMNTHFGFGDDCQVKSVKLIHEYSQKISNLPTFVIGDFNMKPDSLGYAEIVKYFKDVNVCTVNDKGTTFHDYHPEKITDQQIDFCFINNKVTPLNFEIIRDSFDGKFPSDHYGIYSEVDL